MCKDVRGALWSSQKPVLEATTREMSLGGCWGQRTGEQRQEEQSTSGVQGAQGPSRNCEPAHGYPIPGPPVSDHIYYFR